MPKKKAEHAGRTIEEIVACQSTLDREKVVRDRDRRNSYAEKTSDMICRRDTFIREREGMESGTCPIVRIGNQNMRIDGRLALPVIDKEIEYLDREIERHEAAWMIFETSMMMRKID